MVLKSSAKAVDARRTIKIRSFRKKRGVNVEAFSGWAEQMQDSERRGFYNRVSGREKHRERKSQSKAIRLNWRWSSKTAR